MANEKNELQTQADPMPSVWQQNSKGMENLKKARATLHMKHGMFTNIPIVCKGLECPYIDTCWIPPEDLQVGERCPIEIAAVLDRFDKLCEELHVNPEEDIVDAGLVKDVVDIEIMMLRADGLLAKDGAMIEEVVAGLSPKGQEYYKPELHKAVELKERLRKEKTQILSKLMATRKDKNNTGAELNDPSSVAARIIAKVKELNNKGDIIDVTPQIDEGDE